MQTNKGVAVAAMMLLAAVGLSQDFAWAEPQAKVLPNGELEWAPKPFEFRPGAVVRYIDFESGNDANSGTKERPWKHHPWDPAATGAADQSHGPATYVFKRGVVYRGRFVVGADRGEPGSPIQLTSDPGWTTGPEAEARIYGSERVTGWRRAAAPGMPESDKVWCAEVDWLPRTLWQVGPRDTIVRLKLARDPNWEESDPYDVMREWYVWENPEWWKEGSRFHRMQVNGSDRHLGIDTQHLTRPAEDYLGATVWTEWGIVMGSPYPARVEAVDSAQKAVAFRGPWNFEMLEVIARGNRYHLENKPWMLDEAGEYWVERLDDNRGRIFLRLPGDEDPNATTIEAGRHIAGIDAEQLHHVHISGLTFRFNNIHWEYDIPQWAHPELSTAIVRLNGPGDDIVVQNCTFEHVPMPIRLKPSSLDAGIGVVRITDSVMRDTDHGAVQVTARFGEASDTRYAPLGHVDLLRNQMTRIGWRILSGEHGHAVDIGFPTTSHIAGNFLYLIAGWGLSVFGGKPSGATGVEIPLSRNVIHHNRVEDPLVKSNDWGGIETWQGGPHYVFNNLVINPIAFKHWVWREGDPTNIGSFGHAYYLDGSFKNYLFNNIAVGRNNKLGTRSVNTTALQGILGFENTFFHNTFYKFAEMTRQQAPSAGRIRYFSNVMEDVSLLAMRHADPSEGQPDPNAAHYAQGGQFDYKTLAYSRNLFHNLRGKFGVFEETGVVYPTLEQFSDALGKVRAQASSVGVSSADSSLMNAEARDFRPTHTAIGKGSRVFVPWSLYGVCGEWNFARNQANPAEVIDEHWFMTALYTGRERYKDTPRYPLEAHNVQASDYVPGTLEDWTDGALKLNGGAQYLSLDLSAAREGERTPNMDTNSFIVEAVLRLEGKAGTLLSKWDGKTGYSIELLDGRVMVQVGPGLRAETGSALSVGKWHHLLVEVSQAKVSVYVNGKEVPTYAPGAKGYGSLLNDAPLLVAGGPGNQPLAVTLDFLRIARGTLADARTSIEELYRWQFAGPQFTDFAGNSRSDQSAAGALAK